MNKAQRQKEENMRQRVRNPAGGPWVGRTFDAIEAELRQQALQIAQLKTELHDLKTALGSVDEPVQEKPEDVSKPAARRGRPPSKP